MGSKLLLGLVAASALVAMLLLALAVSELNVSLESGRRSEDLRLVGRFLIGALVTIAIGVAATLVAVRWFTSATRGLNAARDEIASVTDRLRQEEAMERSLEERLVEAGRHWAVTFDAIDAVIAVVDQNGRLLRANRFAAELLGERSQDLVGKPLSTWARVDPWRRMCELIEPGIGTGPTPLAASAPSEHLWASDQGRYWVISASHHPEIGGTVFLARDGTDMIEMRAQLERRRRDDEMGAFVAGVAHEVRNPLFSITANLQALQEERDKASVFDEYFGWIQSSATRLQVLMQDLLDYARPPSVQLRECALPEVIQLALAGYVESARRAGIEVRVDVSPGLPKAWMDPQQIEQVFLNLVQNAVALSPPGGKVRVTIAHEPATGLLGSVEDDGPGFSPEEIERGFEPFFTRRKGGTGLGLAVVRRIMDSHGGSVDLGNREGGGARVRLTFPLRGASSTGGPARPTE